MKVIQECSNSSVDISDLKSYYKHTTNEQCKLSSQRAVINSCVDKDIHSEKANILLHTIVSKLSLWEIAEWFMQKDEILDGSIYGIVGKRLAKIAHELSSINDPEKEEMLLKFIKQCFRGVLTKRSGIDLKILKILMELQRVLGITADQQFIWLCLLPNALKEKWTLLASVIPVMKYDEIYERNENILMSILWRAQTRHSSGSVTSECLLAWFISDNSDCKNCARFLANCLTSSNRMRRLNCSRFWLAKLNTNMKSKLIMKETAEIILQMILAENRSSNQVNQNCYLTEEEMCNLACVDYFWNPEKEELVWMRYDRLLYGWISVQKFFIRALESNELGLLRKCLTSYHSILRLDALELSNKLMNKKLFDWSHQFGNIKSFVLQNLDVNNANFRAALLDMVRSSNAKTRKRLQIALLEKLDDMQNDRDRSFQVAFILELLKQCGFNEWLTDMPLMDSLSKSDIIEIRTRFLMCLSPAESNSQNFLTDKFMEMLDNNNTDGLSYLIKMILQFKEPKEILNLIKKSKYKDSNSVKLTLTSLMENFPTESFLDLSFWMDACIKSNSNLISFSGSKHSGHCASLPELYRRLYPSASPTLMISDEQRNAVDQYYHTLKINCEMLASLCKTISTKNIINDAYESSNNSLLREEWFTRCSRAICRETKKFSIDPECTTRNLAFCSMFKIFHEVLGIGNSIVDFLFGNIRACTPPIAVRSMKVVKTFLYMANFDMTYCALKIFKSVLDFYRRSNSMVRNAACHCYAALVHKLIDDTEYGIPLFMFIFQYDILWNEFYNQLKQTTIHDPALILLLSLLEKLRFVSGSFYTAIQLEHLQSMVSKLVSLLTTSPNLRINHLLVSCLLHLVPCRRRLTHRLKRIMEHKLPLNIKNTLNFAILELEAMEFLDSPSDLFHLFCSHSITSLPSLIQKTHKMLIENCFVCLENFGVLLAEIEKYAYSSKELWRLHATYALLILSRTSYNILHHSVSYRYRFISCCRSLLFDEVDCIKRVAFHVVNECGGVTTLSYSWKPLIKLKCLKFSEYDQKNLHC
ncbi:Ribonuclease P protein component [Dirofilaria immitis]